MGADAEDIEEETEEEEEERTAEAVAGGEDEGLSEDEDEDGEEEEEEQGAGKVTELNGGRGRFAGRWLPEGRPCQPGGAPGLFSPCR